MPSSRAIAVRLSLLIAGIFAGLGIYLPFYPVFLVGRGLSPDDIAVILFVPIVIRAAAAPFVASLADRRIDPATFLAVSSLVVGVLFTLTALASGLGMFLMLVTLIALLQSASIPLSDALTITAAQMHPSLHYGRIRLWGSVAYFAANLGGGVLLAQFGGVAIPLAVGLCTMAVVPIVLPLRGMAADPGPATQARGPLGGFLLLILVATALIQASHAFLYSFGSLVWTSQGYDAEAIGAVWALNILGEVALFWFFGSAVGPRFPAFSFIIAGGITAALRWAVMALSPGGAVLALCQLGHALTFGATHLGTIALVSRFAPPGARGRAQGTISAINGGMNAAVTLGSGWLFTRFGADAFWLMVPLALAGTALCVVALVRQPQSARDGG